MGQPNTILDRFRFEISCFDTMKNIRTTTNCSEKLKLLDEREKLSKKS